MNLLTGKTALVAGASRGIGLAIAREICRAGAKTILAARSLEQLETEAAALREEGGDAEALRLDITDIKSLGPLPAIDILINVSGTNVRKRFETFTEEEQTRLLETNLLGLIALTRRVGAEMIARGRGGKIVNIGSLATILGMPYLSIYTVTKSALGGLTRSLAAEWARHNIQVNCIAPGFILTDLNRDVWQSPAMKQWLAGAQPNSRLGSPEDIAPLAVFLSGPGSDYITGQVIAVDGGFSTTSVWPFEPAG